MYDNIVSRGSTTQVLLTGISFFLPANITSIIDWSLKTLNGPAVYSHDSDHHGWNIELDADTEGFYYPGTETPVAKIVLTVPADAELGLLTVIITIYYDSGSIHTGGTLVSHTPSSFDFRIIIVEGSSSSSSSSASSQSSVSSESSASSEVSSSSTSGNSDSSLGSDSISSSGSSQGSTSSLASGGSSVGSSGTSGSSGGSGSSLSSSSSNSGSSQSSLGSRGSSSSSIPCPPCFPLEVPAISEVNFAGFVVTAPDDIPYGIQLQLQIKLEGEPEWSDVGEPVGAGEAVPVQQLQPLTGYWVRWNQFSD